VAFFPLAIVDRFLVSVRCPCRLFLALRLGLRVEPHLALLGRCVFSGAHLASPFVPPSRSFSLSLVIRIFLVPLIIFCWLPNGQFLILWAKALCFRYILQSLLGTELGSAVRLAQGGGAGAARPHSSDRGDLTGWNRD